MLKGNAQFLDFEGGQQELKLKDMILTDGSVVTGKKSILKIKLEDESVLSLGPSSKMSLAQKLDSSPKIIELLQGKLRAIINEKTPVPKEGHKIYIKTRTASMGVRGTDFLIVHNPDNHVTSTITFKGEVNLFKKHDQQIHESLREEFDHDGTIHKINQEQDLHNLEDELIHHSSVSVAPGEVSGAYPSYEKAATPTKLSPEQFIILAQNKDLNFGQKGEVIKGFKNKDKIDNSEKGNDLLVPDPPGDETVPTLKKEYDIKNAQGVRPGGILDLETGFYLSPPAGAEYDERSKTFKMPADLGGINSITGEYVAPSGLKLDPLFGFVPMVSMGPEAGKDRDFQKILEKFKEIDGRFDDRVFKFLKVFKELSRFDLFSTVNYRYTTNSMENYYGERRAITNARTMLWDVKVLGGFQVYNGKEWLHYPKGHFYSIYHQNNRPEVQRNDMMEMMLGWESHYKNHLFHKQARTIFDIEYKREYLDYKKSQSYDFYTKDIGFKISERFQFNRSHLSEAYYQARAFQGYFNANHGNIHNFGFLHRFLMGPVADLQLNYEQSLRKEAWTANQYKINRAGIQFIFLDIFPRTDLSAGYTREWVSFLREPKLDAGYLADQYRPNDSLKSGTYYRANFNLNHRLGSFWKLNGLYEYSRQKTDASGRNKAFIAQTWGGGIIMFF